MNWKDAITTSRNRQKKKTMNNLKSELKLMRQVETYLKERRKEKKNGEESK